MKKYDKFTWWMPKYMVRLTLHGTPQTKLQWMCGTWKIYAAYWRLTYEIAKVILESNSSKSKGNKS